MSVNEKERGGLVYRGVVVGAEADGGGTGSRRWRGSGASAVELVVRGGVSGSGEAC